MDANQLEKLKLTFGYNKHNRIEVCTLIYDKKEKSYHLIEINKSGTLLKDKIPILETPGSYEANAEEYNYCIQNWQRVYSIR